MKISKEEVLNTYKHLAKKVWNFLQSPQCREFLFFLFFVFIAAAFWILQTLNETYETEIAIPLRLKNVPENVVFTNDIPSSLSLRVEDKGTVLTNYMLGQGFIPLTLDFNDYKQKGDHIRLLTTDMEKTILSQLVISTKLLDISPDTLEIIYTQGKGKKLPVKLQGDFSAKRQYYIADINITPDSVMVYAPSTLLENMHTVYTQIENLTDIADTVTHTIPLASVKGAKFIPQQVDVRFFADILTEKTVTVPIVGTGFPAGKQLKTFPSKANITFQIGMHQFKDINADDFTVSISYNDLQTNTPNDHCELKVTKAPASASHIRISPASVEYLIEQDN